MKVRKLKVSFEETGEVRLPKKDEWFLTSGVYCLASWDYETVEYPILKRTEEYVEVEVPDSDPTCTVRRTDLNDAGRNPEYEVVIRCRKLDLHLLEDLLCMGSTAVCAEDENASHRMTKLWEVIFDTVRDGGRSPTPLVFNVSLRDVAPDSEYPLARLRKVCS